MMGISIPIYEDFESRVRLNQHFYHGMSIDEFQHINQVGRAGQLQRFDYGPEVNMERYGSEAPSRVPIENINIPLAVLVGKFTNVF
jgi:hypothetical protein